MNIYKTSNSSQLKKISPTIKTAVVVCIWQEGGRERETVVWIFAGETAIKWVTALWRLKWQQYLKCATPIPTVIMSHMKNQCRILILMTVPAKSVLFVFMSWPIPKHVTSIPIAIRLFGKWTVASCSWRKTALFISLWAEKKVVEAFTAANVHKK